MKKEIRMLDGNINDRRRCDDASLNNERKWAAPWNGSGSNCVSLWEAFQAVKIELVERKVYGNRRGGEDAHEWIVDTQLLHWEYLDI